MSYGQYRAILATRREQSDRAAAFQALHGTYQDNLNTYATIYNGVCQRDLFHARSRGYKTTLEAALHGDNIPTSVVENLIETTRAGAGPLRRYHQLRRKALGVPSYHRCVPTSPSYSSLLPTASHVLPPSSERWISWPNQEDDWDA